MTKRVIVSGLLGGFTMILWTLVLNGVFGFQARMDMNQPKNADSVYTVLKQNVTEPGRYICNPEVSGERGFPGGEPVFSILYGGVGHEAAGRESLIHLVLAFLVVLLAAFLLSLMSDRVLGRYRYRVFVFAGFGLLIVLFSDLNRFGIGGYPLTDALLIGAHNIAMWIVVGMVVAWRLKLPSTAGS